ncbi:SLAM family member 9-like isoform X2 [Lepisosteus oculatus]|uniref:SLAM family member 9-like isoform X2 n=1 Tax=Lepisosteus oculatus TaxID=7918 RepID=UPI00370FBF77
MTLAVCILVFGTLCSAEATAELVVPVFGKEGGSVELRGPAVDRASMKEFFWYFITDKKVRAVKYSNGETVIVPLLKKKYTFNNESLSLTLHDLSSNDTGGYRAEKTDLHGKQHHLVMYSLQVKAPVPAPVIRASSTLTPRGGCLLTLNCSAEGGKEVMLTWRWLDDRIPRESTNETLVLLLSPGIDSFNCSANNTVSTRSSVIAREQFECAGRNLELSAVIGSSALFLILLLAVSGVFYGRKVCKKQDGDTIYENVNKEEVSSRAPVLTLYDTVDPRICTRELAPGVATLYATADTVTKFNNFKEFTNKKSPTYSVVNHNACVPPTNPESIYATVKAPAADISYKRLS